MTDTLTDRPPEGAERIPYEDAALHVSRMARAAGISTQKAYAELLLIADAIGTLEDRGMTREQASLLVPDDLTAA